ncbi:MAG: hypothetical protein ABW167_02385 [Baekduia sp.]
MSIAQRLSTRSDAEVEGGRWASSWHRVNRLLPMIFAATLVVALTWPIIARTNSYYLDWPMHLWFMRHQGYSLLHDGGPSLFMHSSEGVFYPLFAFYGGTFYVIGGLLAASLGGAGVYGYALSWVLTFALAYGGWVWLGRLAGLGWWAVQAPPAVFLTSPYVLTLVYGRGDLPEFVAVCSMPLLIASGLSVLRADRLRVGSAVALVFATILFTGTHNLTLLWGGSLLAVLGLVMYVCSPRIRRQVTGRGAARVAGLVVPAVLINAWFLVPALAYQSHTVIAGLAPRWRFTVEHSIDLLFQSLFTFDRYTIDVWVFALPVLAMGWVASVGALTLRRAWRTSWMLLFVCLGLVVALLVITMLTQGSLVLLLPEPYVMIQYTYRLENYILLAVAGGVLVGLVLVNEAVRWMRVLAWMSLAAVVAVSISGALRQIGHPQSRAVRQIPFWNPPSIDSMGDYADGTVPEVPPKPLKQLLFAAEQVEGSRTSATVDLQPGEIIVTNLMIMPALVHIDGARLIGDQIVRRGDVIQRRAVLRVDADAVPGAARITVSGARPWPVVVGQILSLLGVLGLAANVLLRRLGRRSQRLPTSISSTR